MGREGREGEEEPERGAQREGGELTAQPVCVTASQSREERAGESETSLKGRAGRVSSPRGSPLPPPSLSSLLPQPLSLSLPHNFSLEKSLFSQRKEVRGTLSPPPSQNPPTFPVRRKQGSERAPGWPWSCCAARWTRSAGPCQTPTCYTTTAFCRTCSPSRSATFPSALTSNACRRISSPICAGWWPPGCWR